MMKYIKYRKKEKNKQIPNWRKLEERALKSSVYNGLKIMPQKTSRKLGKRADILAQKKNDSRYRVAGEVKNVLRAQKSHADQAFEYKKYPLCSQKTYVHYPKNVKISEDVDKYFKEKNVKYIRTGIEKKKERQPGLGGFFKPKKYLM